MIVNHKTISHWKPNVNFNVNANVNLNVNAWRRRSKYGVPEYQFLKGTSVRVNPSPVTELQLHLPNWVGLYAYSVHIQMHIHPHYGVYLILSRTTVAWTYSQVSTRPAHSPHPLHPLHPPLCRESDLPPSQIHRKSVRAHQLLARYLRYVGGLFLGVCDIPAHGDPIDIQKYSLPSGNYCYMCKFEGIWRSSGSCQTVGKLYSGCIRYIGSCTP
jgi:hypothetical protein